MYKKTIALSLVTALSFSSVFNSAPVQVSANSTSEVTVVETEESVQTIDLIDVTLEDIKEINAQHSEFTLVPIFEEKNSNIHGMLSQTELDVVPEDEYHIMAIEVRMGKPVHAYGYIPNSKFIDIIKHHQLYGTMLGVTAGLLSMGKVGWILGTIGTMAAFAQAWGIHPFTQYVNTGVNAYIVQVHADGNPNSLSIIQYRYMSGTPLVFVN